MPVIKCAPPPPEGTCDMSKTDAHAYRWQDEFITKNGDKMLDAGEICIHCGYLKEELREHEARRKAKAA